MASSHGECLCTAEAKDIKQKDESVIGEREIRERLQYLRSTRL